MLTSTTRFCDHDDVTQSALPDVIQNPKAKYLYFTETIVTMRVAEDAIDADILVNNGDNSISRAPRDAAFCER